MSTFKGLAATAAGSSRRSSIFPECFFRRCQSIAKWIAACRAYPRTLSAFRKPWDLLSRTNNSCNRSSATSSRSVSRTSRAYKCRPSVSRSRSSRFDGSLKGVLALKIVVASIIKTYSDAVRNPFSRNFAPYSTPARRSLDNSSFPGRVWKLMVVFQSPIPNF